MSKWLNLTSTFSDSVEFENGKSDIKWSGVNMGIFYAEPLLCKMQLFDAKKLQRYLKAEMFEESSHFALSSACVIITCRLVNKVNEL